MVGLYAATEDQAAEETGATGATVAVELDKSLAIFKFWSCTV